MKTWEKILLEVAPPGMEPMVRKLKRKAGVDNPYAVAWAAYNNQSKKKAKQANSAGGLPQTMRDGVSCSDDTILKSMLCSSFGGSRSLQESTGVMEAMETMEGPVVKCVLITEGLGNRSDMHYYGPECIKGGAPLFEGKPCFIDHQSRGEQQDRPERTVRDKCGYFKNVRAETVDGRLGLVAELHFDLSESGRMAYNKACTAIHYKSDLIGAKEEYVGLSISADGELEERTVQVGDEVLDVKYVTNFTQVGSVDEVTSPARGGRFVSVLKQ